MVGILGMIGQGLSSAGDAVAKFAGDAAVQYQKADLERQSILLSGQLAAERTAAEQAGATQRTGMEQTGAGQRTAAEIAGQAANVATEQAGATHRTELEQTGAAARTATEQTGAMARTQAEIAGRARDVAAQLTVQGNELGFGADGSAVITNKQTGKTTPLTDKDGNPVQLQNPAQAQAYTQLLRNAQDDMRYLTQKRGQAQGEVDRLTLPGMGQTPELQNAKKAVADIDAQIQQARDTTASITQAMMQHARVRTSSGPSVGQVINGYRFKGGDPNDKTNYEPVQ